MIWLAVVYLGFTHSGHATSVVAPSFPELVAESQFVVRAKVVAVRPSWVDTPQGRVIMTYVTVDVLKCLKGAASNKLTMQLLGGEIDGQGMRVAGMPQFTVGSSEILFVCDNGTAFCPLVGMMHGRYRVLHDATANCNYIARDDGSLLASVDDVQLPPGLRMVNRLRVGSGLTLESFEGEISKEVARHAPAP